MQRTETLVACLVSIGCGAACSPEPDTTETPGETLEETIVYSTIRPANWDLYLFEEPGAPPQRLTTHPSPDYNAAFSPDGRWVVFTSDRHGTADLFALDLENPGVPVRLTASNAMEDAAAFSPDGRSLAFVSTQSGNPDVFVMPFSPEEGRRRRCGARPTSRRTREATSTPCSRRMASGSPFPAIAMPRMSSSGLRALRTTTEQATSM